MDYLVYILESIDDERFYIGQTNDLEKRLLLHNEGKANKFTRRYRPWSVFHLIQCSSRQQAKKVEAHIKRAKSKKYNVNIGQLRPSKGGVLKRRTTLKPSLEK
jgi:putative endonuclease